MREVCERVDGGNVCHPRAAQKASSPTLGFWVGLERRSVSRRDL